MSSDDDEIEEHTLEPEEVAEIVEWAIGTSALAALLFTAEPAESDEDVAQKLEALEAGIEIMIANMPEVLADPAILRADQAVEAYQETEAIVEDFMAEVEKYRNG